MHLKPGPKSADTVIEIQINSINSDCVIDNINDEFPVLLIDTR